MTLLPYSPKGITAYPSKEKIKVITGPKKNNIKFACVGAIYSFNINFNASANGCKTPYIPTVLGPTRLCIAANCFRSIIVIKATESKIGRSTIKMFTISKEDKKIIKFIA